MHNNYMLRCAAFPLFVVVPMSSNQITKTERTVLKILIKEGSVRSDELYGLLRECNKTIYHALNSLREKGLVRKIPDLTDMRRSFYVLSEELASRLKARMETPVAS